VFNCVYNYRIHLVIGFINNNNNNNINIHLYFGSFLIILLKVLLM
jgi:hypothetical protein